jgi:ring-1,2-phenylacetyl-CoA epoxidase subunit PaaA
MSLVTCEDLAYELPGLVRPDGVRYKRELEELGLERYDSGAELPAEYRDLLLQLVRVQVDVEGILLFKDFFRPYIDLAPTPADRMRITRLYSEEVVHGYTFWKMYRDLGIETAMADFEDGSKAQYIFGYAIETWLDLALLNTLSDRMGVFVFRDTLQCSYRPWARVSQQVYKDERGHCSLGFMNLSKICETDEGREAAQEGLYKWWPATLDMFGRSDSARQWRYVEWGLKENGNEELRQEYVAEMVPILRSIDLEPPPYLYNRRFT